MGRNWAITVGINHYRNFQALHYAKRDAEAMRDYLQHEFNSPYVYHFSDNSPPIQTVSGSALNSLPTYAALCHFFDVRFERPFLHPGDNLWFFFSGYGCRHSGRDYLMPIDADPSDVERTAISLHYVTERLQRCGADNVILFIDGCRTKLGCCDGFGQEYQPGVITFFSCRPGEFSSEIKELQQGAFTYALLESLKIQGEGNCATVERLVQRLDHTLPELNQRFNQPAQHLYSHIEPPIKNCLILLPQKAEMRDVLALKYSAANAESQQNYILATQFWIRVLAILPNDQEAIKRIERSARASADLSAQRPTLSSSISIPSQIGASTASARLSISYPKLSFEVLTVDTQGTIIATEQMYADYQREILGKDVLLDMMMIPGEDFMMGQTESEKANLIQSVGEENYQQYFTYELPSHLVTVSPFLMGKYPITQAQWAAVTRLPKVMIDLSSVPSRFKGDHRPVEQVSWYEAMEFCARLSQQTGRVYRLPSEAEWEYACRAGTTTPFHFGPTITPNIANYNGYHTYENGPEGFYREQTTDVRNFKVANAFGLYDMHGNIWEWCLDYWHASYESAPIDGSAWQMGEDSIERVLRGGAWDRHPRHCRSATRSRFKPDRGNYLIGFRVVCASAHQQK